ncbi:MAG: hypothetical protein ACI35O_11900 [Bacillaceae bacterium]
MANEVVIMCERCGRLIELRSDLVTSTLVFDVAPYHEDFYAKDLKGTKTLFLSNAPINGAMCNIVTVVAILVTIILFGLGEGPYKLAALFPLIQVVYRGYSYFKYERHLEP